MDKIWINKEKGSDKILAIGNNMLYKINPKENIFNRCLSDLEKDIAQKNAMTIPFSYIKHIQYFEGKKYIQIFFGNASEEHWRIENESVRFQVFKHLKENLPKTEYTAGKFNLWKTGKRSFSALAVVSALFFWLLYLALEIEKGYEYTIVGHSRKGVGELILGIANMGSMKIIFIFCPLLLLVAFNLIRKLINRPIVHEIAFVDTLPYSSKGQLT